MAEISDFLDADSSNDCTPAFNRAVTAIGQSKGDRTLRFPSGSYAFRTQPSANPFGLNLVGESMSSTALRKFYSDGRLLHFTALSGLYGGGCADLSVWAAPGYAPGYGVVLRGNDQFQPNYSVFRNVDITGPGLWHIPLLMDGSAMTGAGGRAKDMRDCTLTNVFAFNATAASLYMRSAIGATVVGGGVLSGAGPISASGLWISGTVDVPSTQIDIVGLKNSGQLNITRATHIRYFGSIGQLNTDASSHCVVIGQCDDPTGNALVHSTVILN